ncbi:hypothetical protein [Cytophaga aurantiaca]|uniref:hypothetical protein n=1 Tax=Cytophaga aurantiaca TaxID=29530 RepID=UPI00035F1C72|nr:hypothetical protein [Cytophaga aurantiaca]
MKTEKKKTDFLLAFFRGVAIFLVIIAISFPMLIFSDIIPLKINGYNEVGDAFGGIVNPLIAAVGVAVTFLAFYIQYQANQQQLEQISQNKKEQNDLLKQQMFFKLMDNQQQRIFNLSKMNYGIRGASPDITGTAALDSILKNDNENFKETGKEILSSNENIIEYDIIDKIFQYNFNAVFDAYIDFQPLIEKVIEANTYQNRVKAIEDYIPINKEQVLESILNSIGRYYFFYTSNKTKLDFFKRRYHSIASKNQTFIDGYIKGFEHIINLLKDNGLNKDDTFIDYLKYNLTIGEQKILFLYFASGNGKTETKTFVLENGLLLDLCNDTFLSNHENHDSLMKEEIRAILSK